MSETDNENCKGCLISTYGMCTLVQFGCPCQKCLIKMVCNSSCEELKLHMSKVNKGKGA